ncbi:MAG: alpha/beta fold hydrolase [Paracoccaceae bacterium]|nr:alpha/beta fold hydrolase [Paracoccaceae bacterium]
MTPQQQVKNAVAMTMKFSMQRALQAAFASFLLAILTITQTAEAQQADTAGRLAIQTIPFPAGVARAGGNVSYTAPDFAELRRTVTYEGQARNYYIYAPQSSASAPRQAIVLLHGAQRSGRSMIDMWLRTANRHNIILIAPDSFGPSWSPAEDHPNFLITALRDAHTQAPIQPEQVYLFGHSAGGILATLYANRLGTPWRAIATHAGVLDAEQVVPAQVAPPMRHYIGLNDHLFSGRAAQSTAQALSEAGHDVDLVMITSHTHWYYDIGPHLSEEIWKYWQGLD